MWNRGTIWMNEGKTGYDYWVKHYGEPSEVYGLNGGRISKLEIRKHSESHPRKLRPRVGRGST